MTSPSGLCKKAQARSVTQSTITAFGVAGKKKERSIRAWIVLTDASLSLASRAVMLRNRRSSSSELNATRRVALPLPSFVVVTEAAEAEAEARKETRRNKGTKQAMIGRRRPKQKQEAIRGWWISFGGACRLAWILY